MRGGGKVELQRSIRRGNQDQSLGWRQGHPAGRDPPIQLFNAARYAKRDVRVSFNVHGGMNQLFVGDDGPGIPEKDRQRALESFVQPEQSSGKKSGFGLGLAIVKRAIEWHRGEVVISRSPMGGARICATWPAIPPNRELRASELRQAADSKA
jgi:hypothetical protein